MSAEAPYTTSDELTPGPWYLDPTWGPSEQFPNWAAIKLAETGIGISGHIGAANARLIVAAPEMLVALQKAADTFKDLSMALTLLGRSDSAAACRIAEKATREVIAKAEGK